MSFRSQPLPLLTTSAALCLLASLPLSAHAAIVSTNTATATNVDPAQTVGGSSSLSVVGSDSGALAAFSVIDFVTAGLGFTDQTRAASLNSLSLSLTDLNTNPLLATGIVDIYISTSITSPASLSFQAINGPQGIGTQLNTLTEVANIDLSTTGGKGTTFTPNFTLDAPTTTFILNEINVGKPIRVVLAADSSSVAGSFQGTTAAPPLAAPVLKFNVNTATRRAGDANGDNVVDIQDLTIVANHWQQAVSGAANGDFDDSGFVDIQDLTAIANNWQAGAAGGGGSDFGEFLVPGVSSVPEPGTVFLLGLGGAMLLRRRV